MQEKNVGNLCFCTPQTHICTIVVISRSRYIPKSIRTNYTGNIRGWTFSCRIPILHLFFFFFLVLFVSPKAAKMCVCFLGCIWGTVEGFQATNHCSRLRFIIWKFETTEYFLQDFGHSGVSEAKSWRFLIRNRVFCAFTYPDNFRTRCTSCLGT